MDDVLRDYHDDLCDQDKSELTIRAYMADLRAFADWFRTASGESLHPSSITPMDLIDYRNTMVAEGKKPSTINRRLISISRFCRWAETNGLIINNPAEGIGGVAEESLGPRSLSRKEQLAFVRAVRKSGKLRDLAIITMLLHTGMRVNELCNVRRSDITLSENSNMVIIRKGKGSKRRVIPLNPTVTKVIRDYLASLSHESVVRIAGIHPEETHLFYGQKGQPFTTRGIRHMIQKYGYIAKIKHVSPHIFRHTCAKNLIDTGESIDRVALILGHSSVNTTAIYTMPTEQDLQKTMERLAWE